MCSRLRTSLRGSRARLRVSRRIQVSQGKETRMSLLHPIFAEILKPFAPKEGQHTGLVVKDLYAQVDNTLELAAAAEALRIRNAPICRNCRHAKGEHSHERAECPAQFFRGDLFRP